MPEDESLVPYPSVELVRISEVPALLDRIRPHWQAKDLINRVRRLLQVDPSSACQRILNAAMHDLKEKVAIAGIDIAQETASRNKLPPVTKSEDLESYATAKLIDLAYHMGLLTRPEWRRVSRCYEIRRDLEHEDDEYEAGVEDCIYIFKTCVEVILSRDPVQPLRISDVKEVVDQPAAVTPTPALVADYQRAPQPRQEELARFLISTALDETQPEIVRENAFSVLSHFGPLTQNAVKLKLVDFFQSQLGRSALLPLQARVAIAAGVMPYLKEADRDGLFARVYSQMQKVGHEWHHYSEHGELLRGFQELDGLKFCPAGTRRKILRWLVLAYIGAPGGVTRYGNFRPVYYSNVAEPLIEEILGQAREIIAKDLPSLGADAQVKPLLSNPHIARRFEALLDLVGGPAK